MLRTKIKKGEGTVLLPPGQEGAFRDGRLLTMSCSDKLARWGKGVKFMINVTMLLLILLLVQLPLPNTPSQAPGGVYWASRVLLSPPSYSQHTYTV